MSRRHKLAALAVFLVVCYAAAALGSAATAGSVSGPGADWYRSLERPSFQPPDWVFGPVWTVLYGLMAVAAWLVYVKTRRIASAPMILFAVQLALNVAWSIIFFGLQRPGLAVLDIALLLASLIATTIAFRRESTPAAAMMIPYLAWVLFAAALNVSIWRLNP